LFSKRSAYIVTIKVTCYIDVVWYLWRTVCSLAVIVQFASWDNSYAF